ncbi:hypothetical protein [Legionella sp. km772]|uniref:hypothetical protein n=1 Tax=Legionella sp. km772 TaxID=2498111 RepID=UPI000F8E149A|nr:hypothetical protein [Legionella sp. km772]RUR06314.1 hypothetical protein ELY15_13335 [Legionella sp. km772]
MKNSEPVSLTVGEKTWRFQLDAKIEYKDDNPTLSGFITASLQTSRGLETFSYTLRHISNPDGIIFRTNMADAHRVSYVRRDWNGLQTSHVTLFLQEQLIKMALLKKDSHSYHRTAMSFSQRRSDNFDLKLRLYGCPPVLIKQIKQLISPSMEEENLLEPTPMPLIRV